MSRQSEDDVSEAASFELQLLSKNPSSQRFGVIIMSTLAMPFSLSIWCAERERGCVWVDGQLTALPDYWWPAVLALSENKLTCHVYPPSCCVPSHTNHWNSWYLWTSDLLTLKNTRKQLAQEGPASFPSFPPAFWLEDEWTRWRLYGSFNFSAPHLRVSFAPFHQYL